MQSKSLALAALVLALVLPASPAAAAEVSYFDVPQGDHPHDVAPAPDGTVWYTGQRAGVLGRLNPDTGQVDRIPLGEGSGAALASSSAQDGAAWITDGGPQRDRQGRSRHARGEDLEASQGPRQRQSQYARIRRKRPSLVHRAVRYLWPARSKTGEMQVWDAPKGVGPYGITATPDGAIYYVSLAGSFLGKPDLDTGKTTVIEPKSPGVGTRRVWSDSKGRLWVSEWNAGNLSVYDPAAHELGGLQAAGRGAARLRGLCRRQGQGVAQRLWRQRRPQVRS
jgi:virginiamycin B lyase